MNPITEAIIELRKEYMNKGCSPQEINDGECDEFAYALQNLGLGTMVKEVDLLDHSWSDEMVKAWLGVSFDIKHFNRKKDESFIHAFLQGNDGRYYDSETPEGVENPEDLLIYQRIKRGEE